MSFFDDASLAFLPSGAAGKDGKAYSIKPTDGTGDFTFSRGSNLAATRVGADGLIEKGRENLIKQSNNFDTSPWTNSSATLTSGQSGYDGSSDAWLFNSDATGQSYINQAVSQSGVQTFSVYLKKGTADFATILVRLTASYTIYIDLRDGSYSNPTFLFDEINIEDVGNDWWRVKLRYNASVSFIRIFVADALSSFDSAVGDNIYIQDAQLEIGLAVTDVIESGATTGKAGLLEDEPRFDYSGGATCPSLLLEPSRTNLIPQSEYFDSWTKIGTPTITTNYGISPDGSKNSTRFETPANDRIYTNTGTTIAANETFSIYMKGSGVPRIILGNTDTIDIILTNEWKRYDLTTSVSSTNDAIQIRAAGTALDMEIWGAQYEAGSYRTSYIPNHSGGSVTRGVDSVTTLQNLRDNGITTSGAYTLFFDLSADTEGRNDSDNSQIVNLFSGQNATSETISIRKYDNTIFGRLRVYSNTDAAFMDYVDSTNRKYAMVVNGTNVKFFTDGAKEWEYNGTNQQDNLGSLKFNYGHSNRTSTNWNQILLFPKALSDADCITLTTL